MRVDNRGVRQWAAALIYDELCNVQAALDAYCRRRRSSARVHRTRKALARLQSALTDLRTVTPGSESLRQTVRQLHRRAGRVRDADVLLDRLETYRGAAPANERNVIDSLIMRLERRRRKANRRFRKTVRRSKLETAP